MITAKPAAKVIRHAIPDEALLFIAKPFHLILLRQGNAAGLFQELLQFRQVLEITLFVPLNVPDMSTPGWIVIRLPFQPDTRYERPWCP